MNNAYTAAIAAARAKGYTLVKRKALSSGKMVHEWTICSRCQSRDQNSRQRAFWFRSGKGKATVWALWCPKCGSYFAKR